MAVKGDVRDVCLRAGERVQCVQSADKYLDLELKQLTRKVSPQPQSPVVMFCVSSQCADCIAWNAYITTSAPR